MQTYFCTNIGRRLLYAGEKSLFSHRTFAPHCGRVPQPCPDCFTAKDQSWWSRRGRRGPEWGPATDQGKGKEGREANGSSEVLVKSWNQEGGSGRGRRHRGEEFVLEQEEEEEFKEETMRSFVGAGGSTSEQQALLRDVDIEKDEKLVKSKQQQPVRIPPVLVASFLTVFTSSQGILTTLSQTDGKYEYDYATVPFLSEIVKLCVSASFLWKEMQKGPAPRITRDWRSVCLYPIPSIIYVLHNNIQFATLTYVDTATYQILGNLKIVTTGILFRFFLKKKLSKLQWMAIALLTVGTTTSQLRGCGQTNCDKLLASPLEGYLLALLSACLSALAGVYTEFLMKKNDDSLHWQNVQLYAFGVLFNGMKLAAVDLKDKFANGLWFVRLFHGYNVVTLLVVINLGCTGLLVSWIMKFADNIVKVYSTSMAMLLTMVISVYLFSLVPTLQLFLGIVICGISLQLYFTPAQQLLDAPAPQK